MPNSNIELLTKVAKKLGPLLREVVFVGGCTTGLLITEEAAAEVRPTFDVDVIAEITTYAGYAAFSERLRALGFREDSSKGAPLCRWLIDAVKLDVMPLEEKILGFTNRWYPAAMDAAQETVLEPGLRIRVVTAPYFVATKLEAFCGRGRGDYAGSHDLEDLLTVIDGRAAIVQEIGKAASVRSYIAEQFQVLLKTPAFVDALSGHLLPDPGSQARLPLLRERMEAISSMGA
jgi:predicted nucleotidyltransferase